MKPALLIIDMQNDGNKPESRLFVRDAVPMIPVINRLTAAARAAGLPVIWVNQQHRHQIVDFGREADISPVHCVEGTAGVELIDGLVTHKDDYLVVKRRYSGFYCTDLELLLRSLGVDTVVVTGIMTDGCVLMTSLDAHARDFYLRVVSDATATVTEEDHQAALRILSHTQPGVVVTSEEAVKIFG